MGKRGKRPGRDRPTLEDRLDRISELRDEPDPERVRSELRRFLADRSPYLVARAAKLTGELAVDDLGDDLVAAFDRCMVSPETSDKGCVAKTAVARVLLDLEQPRAGLFLRGARHRQLEAAYGAPVDTAAELRGICALGLVSAGHPDAVIELATLLADSEWSVRASAARALGCSGRPSAEPLLRFKARLGDAELDVRTECFGALLQITPNGSLDFVAGFLDDSDLAAAEAAALALGESRLEAAVEALARAAERTISAELRRTLLLAVAMTRRESALDYLLRQVEQQPRRAAGEALVALAIHRHDERVRGRVEAALAERGGDDLRSLFEREFHGGQNR